MRANSKAIALVLALWVPACGVGAALGDASPGDTSPGADAATRLGADSGSLGDAAIDAVDAMLRDVPATGDDGPTGADVRSSGDGSGEASVDAGAPSVRLVGRIDYSDPAGPSFEWSGVSIEARFRGTGVTLHLNDPGNYFRVAIDGVEHATLVAHTGTTSYTLATGLADGVHTLEVWRQTEAGDGVTQFLGLTFPSGGALLTPPPAPAHRIEVIGDSFTCGFGDEGTAPCPGTPADENNYLDYAPVAARALGAELHTVAWTGKGLYRNWDTSTTATIPDLYDRTLGNESGHAWNFASWTPDAVLITLGDNDYNMGDPGQAFTDAYVAFVQRVRGHYPHAYILAICQPGMHAAARIMAALATLRSDGESNVGYYQLESNPGLYSGCNNHPNVMAHAAMGAQLATALRSTLHW